MTIQAGDSGVAVGFGEGRRSGRGRYPTFAQRWHESVAAVGDRSFLTFEDRSGRLTTWTYSEFDALVARLAGDLAARGVGPGRPVHLALANSPAFVAVWLAAARLGAAFVPSDPRATSRELAVHITRARPALGVATAAQADEYRAGASGLEVLVVDEDDCELAGIAVGRPVPTSSLDPETPAAVMFTSGTTSAPKGVVVTQANYAFAGDVMASAAAVTAADRLLVVLPLFHGNAQYYSFAAAISAGAAVSLMSSFSASRFLEQAASHGATHASLFAAPMRMILASGSEPVEGVCLRHVWYAQNVSDDQYEALARLFGCRPRQLYGMTETLPAVLTTRALDSAPGSMGRPTLGCRVDLWNPETREPVAGDEVGEIVVGGLPGLTLFGGYLDDPETTAASFERGFFRTGDLAWRDESDRYYFAGRRSDVLKVAGENVSTVEVESVLAAHPGVFEAAVVGEPDPIRDEVPVAYVVRAREGELLSEADLEAYCASQLAPSKRPRRFAFVEELPRTSVGKIRKFLLEGSGGSGEGVK